MQRHWWVVSNAMANPVLLRLFCWPWHGRWTHHDSMRAASNGVWSNWHGTCNSYCHPRNPSASNSLCSTSNEWRSCACTCRCCCLWRLSCHSDGSCGPRDGRRSMQQSRVQHSSTIRRECHCHVHWCAFCQACPTFGTSDDATECHRRRRWHLCDCTSCGSRCGQVSFVFTAGPCLCPYASWTSLWLYAPDSSRGSKVGRAFRRQPVLQKDCLPGFVNHHNGDSGAHWWTASLRCAILWWLSEQCRWCRIYFLTVLTVPQEHSADHFSLRQQGWLHLLPKQQPGDQISGQSEAVGDR
mmetsp:Transcript_31872/g.74516  ORF Transcript_31872/g.74516 Transcript_31872/m.74516 type:complete len:297 (-) Transcript_31872:349-1239(-)